MSTKKPKAECETARVRMISIRNDDWAWLKSQPIGATKTIVKMVQAARKADQSNTLKRENDRLRDEVIRLTGIVNAKEGR